MVNIPKERKTFCKSKKCSKHSIHKVTQYKAGKASNFAQVSVYLLVNVKLDESVAFYFMKLSVCFSGREADIFPIFHYLTLYVSLSSHYILTSLINKLLYLRKSLHSFVSPVYLSTNNWSLSSVYIYLALLTFIFLFLRVKDDTTISRWVLEVRRSPFSTRRWA